MNERDIVALFLLFDFVFACTLTYFAYVIAHAIKNKITNELIRLKKRRKLIKRINARRRAEYLSKVA